MMHERPPRPDQSQPLEGFFTGTDDIDLQILMLLSQRFSLLQQEGAIPQGDEDERKRALAAIRRKAFELGIPVGLVADFWERMFDASAAITMQAARRSLAKD